MVPQSEHRPRMEHPTSMDAPDQTWHGLNWVAHRTDNERGDQPPLVTSWVLPLAAAPPTKHCRY